MARPHMMNRLRHETTCLPPVSPLPDGEGYGRSLREIMSRPHHCNLACHVYVDCASEIKCAGGRIGGDQQGMFLTRVKIYLIKEILATV